MRVLAANQVIEDIDNYNRVREMFSIMTASDSRTNVNAEAFGQQWDTSNYFSTALTNDSLPGLIGGQSQTVSFKPLSGLPNQNKMIPCRYCPITI